MIVCVCNRLSEGACREAACRAECQGVGCVYRLLGARVRCGRCVPHMRSLLETAQAAQAMSAPSAAGAAAPASGR